MSDPKEIELLQSQYDIVTKQLAVQKKAQNLLKQQGIDLGYRLKGSKWVKDVEVYGIFYDFTYYSHFDGHASGAVNDYYKGANISSIDTFNFLKNIIVNNDFGDEEEIWEHLDCTPLYDCGFDEIPYNDSSDKAKEKFKKYLTLVSDSEIKWEYKGRQDQGELCDGSFFTIRKAPESQIKSVKNKEYTKTD